MGGTVGENDPSPLRAALPRPSPRHVNDLVIVKAGGVAFSKRVDGDASRLLTENAAAAPRRIFCAAERDEEQRANGNPYDVQRPESPSGNGHGSYNNDR